MPHANTFTSTRSRQKQKSHFTFNREVNELSLNLFDEESSHSYPSAKLQRHLRKKSFRLSQHWKELSRNYYHRNITKDGSAERSYEGIKVSNESADQETCFRSTQTGSNTHNSNRTGSELDSNHPDSENNENWYGAHLENDNIKTEQDSLNTDKGNGYHGQTIISVDIENDSFSDDSEDCVLLNDNFYKKTQNMINNEEELMKISEGVIQVENELVNLSKLHKNIKDDLVIQWTCQNQLQSSSSSEDICERFDSIKHDGAKEKCIPLGKGDRHKKLVSKTTEKKRIIVDNTNAIPRPLTYQGTIWTSQIILKLWRTTCLYSQNLKSLLNQLVPNVASKSPSQRNESVCRNHLTSQISAKPQTLSDTPSEDNIDKQGGERYIIFLEEQNYRAIQMIESRLTHVEDKMETLQTITLDIRNLIQSNMNNPERTREKSQTKTSPPPPPPLPPPQMLFFPLRSATSHNSSLPSRTQSSRTQNNPRTKPLRPAITVDDLRSVTLKKVSKEQIQQETTTAT